jgi:hypothetical protein
MAISVTLFFEGIGQNEYEQIHEAVFGGGYKPEGAWLHAAGPANDGWQVVDIWESKSYFDNFVQNVLGPKMAELGIDAKPQPVIAELFNIWAPGASQLADVGADWRPAVSV